METKLQQEASAHPVDRAPRPFTSVTARGEAVRGIRSAACPDTAPVGPFAGRYPADPSAGTTPRLLHPVYARRQEGLVRQGRCACSLWSGTGSMNSSWHNLGKENTAEAMSVAGGGRKVVDEGNVVALRYEI